VRISRIVKEFPYRAARLELMPEEPYAEDDPLTQSEKHALATTFRKWAGAVSGEPEEKSMAEVPQSYEALVNAVCMATEASALEKLALLELDSVLERGRRVRALTEQRLTLRRPPTVGGG
jgi:Lon protease-like protein